MEIKFMEFIGMIFSMLGAFYMSKSVVKDPLTMYKAGISFLIANCFMIFVAIGNQLGALAIQMLLFYISSIIIIMSFTQNKKEAKKYLTYLSVTIGIIIIINIPYFNWNNMFSSKLDIIAATMAISGSFMLKYKNENIKILAFTLFLFADFIYAYIGYEKHMYFFMTQAIFFWYTSIIGILNSLNTKQYQLSI